MRLINIRPDILDFKNGAPTQFSLDSMYMDSKQYFNTLDVNLGELASGKTRQIHLNFSTAERVNAFLNKIRKFRTALYAIFHLFVRRKITLLTVISTVSFMYESKLNHPVS